MNPSTGQLVPFSNLEHSNHLHLILFHCSVTALAIQLHFGSDGDGWPSATLAPPPPPSPLGDYTEKTDLILLLLLILFLLLLSLQLFLHSRVISLTDRQISGADISLLLLHY